MTPDYPHITKSLDTITPISADMCGSATASATVDSLIGGACEYWLRQW